MTSSTDTGLAGPIDGVNWGAMTSLQSLVLSSGGLSGALPLTWPASLTSLSIALMNTTSSLSSLNWSNTTTLSTLSLTNMRGITIGQTPGNAIPSTITTLAISYRPSIPILYSLTIFALQQYTHLQSLTLQGFLYGALTSNLESMPNLNFVDFSYNFFNGSLDAINWGSIPQLKYLLLNSNSFTAFGNAFTNTSSLQQLYLTGNAKLNGTLPAFLLDSTTSGN